MSPVLRLLDLEFGSDSFEKDKDKLDGRGGDGVVVGLELGNKNRFRRRGCAAAISSDMLTGLLAGLSGVALPSSSAPERAGLGEAIAALHRGH